MAWGHQFRDATWRQGQNIKNYSPNPKSGKAQIGAEVPRACGAPVSLLLGACGAESHSFRIRNRNPLLTPTCFH